jgi:adenosylmethionine-8-amino-7-oxononanoate aminotransferase
MTITETPPSTIDAERAVRHLWPHAGTDSSWEEIVTGGLNVFQSGHGSTLVDTTGREYLDAFSGLCVVNVGHGRAEIGEAMARQAATLGFTAPSNTANTTMVALADKLASVLPGDLNRVFFCSSGSDAVESAIKIAKQTQVLRGFPRRYKIITRRGSYHGGTGGTVWTSPAASEKYFGPFAPGGISVPSPNRYRNDFGVEGEAGDLLCARYVEQEILAQGPEHVAAVLAEPVSLSNGTHVPSAAYWRELREICDRHGVLLIVDEVITGYGRTGAMFGIEHFGVVPDIIATAKGLSSGYAAIAAVGVRDSVFEAFTEPGTTLYHILTFGGSAVSGAAALANIEIIEREGLVERSAVAGSRLLGMLEPLRAHPTVGDVRGLGLMCALELVKDKDSKTPWDAGHPFVKTVDHALRSRGVLTRVLTTVLHLVPPLVITDAELDRLVQAVDESLAEAEDEYAREIG